VIRECRIGGCRRAIEDESDGLCAQHVEARERYGDPVKITRRPAHLPAHLVPIWDEMAGQVTTAIGLAGLEALVGQVYRLRTAEEKITTEGLVVADAKGNPTPHPALKVEKDAQSEIRRWLHDFGAR
jgi:phage terminase small subunit